MFVLSLLAILGAAQGCGKCTLPGRPNVIVVVIDTLRADRLVAGGAKQQICSCMNRLAEEAFCFRSALAPAPWTKPSVASLFTGLYPGQHGALGSLHFNRNLIDLDPRFVTLAERLKAEGYDTGAFVTNPHLSAYYHFDQGFDTYHQPAGTADRVFTYGLQWIFDRSAGDGHEAGSTAPSPSTNGDDDVNPEGKAPFFLYLHAVDPHAPYAPPEKYRRLFLGRNPGPGPEAPMTRKGEFTEILLWLDQYRAWKAENTGEPFRFDYSSDWLKLRAPLIEAYMPLDRITRVDLDFSGEDDPKFRSRVDYLIGLYNGEAAFSDESLRRFLETLERNGVLDDTLVIVTSDHGEALLEHDMWGHGHEVFNEEIHVPLLFRIPAKQGLVRGVCDEPVSLVDIYPTVMDMMGLSGPDTLSGVSLWPVMEGGSRSALKDRAVFSEMIKQRQEQVAVVRGGAKLVREALDTGEAHYDYFDLDEDPGELHPLSIEEAGAEARRLKSLLDGFLKSRKVDFERKGNKVEPTREEIRQLQELGYI